MDHAAPVRPTRWPMIANFAAQLDVSDVTTGQLTTLTAACFGLTDLLANLWRSAPGRKY